MPKKLEVKEEIGIHTDAPVQTEKESLLALHKQLKDLKVNRLSELEGLIARAEG